MTFQTSGGRAKRRARFAIPASRDPHTALAVLCDLYRDRHRVLAESGRDTNDAAVEVADWREACAGKGIGRTGFAEASEALAKRGLIRFERPYVYLAESRTNPKSDRPRVAARPLPGTGEWAALYGRGQQ